MFKIFSNFCGAVLVFSMAGTTGAAEDSLNQLIQKIEYKSQTQTNEGKRAPERLDQLETQLLGRASWDIQCWMKVYDEAKICVMQKNHITVVRFNDRYSVNIGEKHLKDSLTELRIDQRDPITTREGLYREGEQVIDQMKKGYNIYTRHHERDQKKPVEHKISLIGFTSAFVDMEDRFKKLSATNPKL